MSFATSWLVYFDANRRGRVGVPSEARFDVHAELRGALVRSLQRFQIGEQGDGAHLRRGAVASGDADYSAAVELFIKEEQEHARLLSEVLARLNAPLLPWHWSDVCFTLSRRLLGLRWEVLVLMVAELIGKRYYQTLHEGVSDRTLCAIFGQIMRDEIGHIAFHTEFLEQAFGTAPVPIRLIVCAGWWLLFRGACEVVVSDHASVLRAIGLPVAEFRADCCALGDTLIARIITAQSDVRCTRPVEDAVGRRRASC